MKVTYSDRYVIDLPAHHTFPIRKYSLICERLRAEAVIQATDLIEPPPALNEDLLLVHTSDYLNRVQQGELSVAEIRRLGLPWSQKLVMRSHTSVQGTLISALNALDRGIAANLGGGTHHAYADHGEGYCVFNDMAVAIRVLRREGLIERALVVDLDVHQGNGTAVIFANDLDTFTFSMHGANNYPLRKEQSRLDLALPDATTDEEYLALLQQHLPGLLTVFEPDIVFYQAGVDPLAGDRLGRLALSMAGLSRRDEYVLASCAESKIPVVITLGGGYAREVENTVEAHCNTIRQARAIFGG